LNIDIVHIGDREMSRYANNAFALVAALTLTLLSFYEVARVPAVAAPAAVEIA
jgi:hypothetical protein